MEASAVAAELAAGGDYAVAGDYDRDGVAVIGRANGAEGLGVSDGAGDLGVAAGFAVGDGLQGLPAGLLELGAAEVQGEGEVAEMAAEIFFQFGDVGAHLGGGMFEGYGVFVVGAFRVGVLVVETFFADVAGVGADGLLAGEAGVEFEGHQAFG